MIPYLFCLHSRLPSHAVNNSLIISIISTAYCSMCLCETPCCFLNYFAHCFVLFVCMFYSCQLLTVQTLFLLINIIFLGRESRWVLGLIKVLCGSFSCVLQALQFVIKVFFSCVVMWQHHQWCPAVRRRVGPVQFTLRDPLFFCKLPSWHKYISIKSLPYIYTWVEGMLDKAQWLFTGVMQYILTNSCSFWSSVFGNYPHPHSHS